MKLLLLGPNGQVGWELQRCLLPLGQVYALGRDTLDLAEPERLRALIRDYAPDVIVNAAAYTAVDRAQQEPDLAACINATVPTILAQEAERCAALLLHYSTDYVFDGLKAAAYTVDDATAPLNVYGQSKLAGEHGIVGTGADHLILRTSWVYSARGSNFLLTMLQLMRQRETLAVIADQQGAPTWARLIAEVSALVIAYALRERRQGVFASGVYHLTASGATSWHGFAESIAEMAGQYAAADSLAVRTIDAITTAQYGGSTPRPLNSRLDTTALCQRFAVTLPPWQQALALCMDELYTSR